MFVFIFNLDVLVICGIRITLNIENNINDNEKFFLMSSYSVLNNRV